MVGMRASFAVTLGLVALTAACRGATPSTGPGSSDGSTEACPASAPASGSSCSTDLLYCGYSGPVESCDCTYPGGYVGTWECASGPCPPGVDCGSIDAGMAVDAGSCPATDPRAYNGGIACPSVGQSCNYQYPYIATADCRDECTCDPSGTWSCALRSCSFPGCPYSQPANGDSCLLITSGAHVPACDYGNDAGCSTQCSCMDGFTWACTSKGSCVDAGTPIDGGDQ
ncbi:MAG TPA: hypothetical protein VF765_30800 [Polyangiaceae bacterium]